MGFSQEGGTSGLALVIDQHCVKRGSSSVLLIVLGVIGGLLVLACISTVVYLMCKAAKYRQQHAVVNDDCKYSHRITSHAPSRRCLCAQMNQCVAC